MLSPDFKLYQDDHYVLVTIRLPYIKVSASQFFISVNSFKFYLKPYSLSLCFKQYLAETEEPAKAVYYSDKYLLAVSLAKKNLGEHFEDLGLLTNILNKKSNNPKKYTLPSIEVISETSGILEDKEQKYLDHAGSQCSSEYSLYGYGFCRHYYKVFDHLDEYAYELFSFNPSDVPSHERLKLSVTIIYNNFDIDSYLFDKFDNEYEILQIVNNIEASKEIYRQQENLIKNKYHLVTKNSSKEVLVNPKDHPSIYKQLFSISFAYLYELNCMEGEFGIESPKTINRCAGVLACNIEYCYYSIEEIFYDCVRRCFTYSLYKHISIAYKCLKMLKVLCNRQALLTIMLYLKVLFDKSEPRYLLNKIYIYDYITYLRSGTGEYELEKLRKTVFDIDLKADKLGLKIDILDSTEGKDDEAGNYDSAYESYDPPLAKFAYYYVQAYKELYEMMRLD